MAVELDQITYYRVRKPPSLKQYLVQRNVALASSQVSGKTGTKRIDGNLMPKSASELKKSLTGITADIVAERNPEWVRDYTAFLKSWKEKHH